MSNMLNVHIEKNHKSERQVENWGDYLEHK